jgi:hypothetical protein
MAVEPNSQLSGRIRIEMRRDSTKQSPTGDDALPHETLLEFLVVWFSTKGAECDLEFW